MLQRLEFHYTPKHASWLNMVERAAFVRVLIRSPPTRPWPQHERSGGRHVGRNERDAGLHQPGDEVDIAGQPVELGDQQGRPMTSEHAVIGHWLTNCTGSARGRHCSRSASIESHYSSSL